MLVPRWIQLQLCFHPFKLKMYRLSTIHSVIIFGTLVTLMKLYFSSQLTFLPNCRNHISFFLHHFFYLKNDFLIIFWFLRSIFFRKKMSQKDHKMCIFKRVWGGSLFPKFWSNDESKNNLFLVQMCVYVCVCCACGLAMWVGVLCECVFV